MLTTVTSLSAELRTIICASGGQKISMTMDMVLKRGPTPLYSGPKIRHDAAIREYQTWWAWGAVSNCSQRGLDVTDLRGLNKRKRLLRLTLSGMKRAGSAELRMYQPWRSSLRAETFALPLNPACFMTRCWALCFYLVCWNTIGFSNLPHFIKK